MVTSSCGSMVALSEQKSGTIRTRSGRVILAAVKPSPRDVPAKVSFPRAFHASGSTELQANSQVLQEAGAAGCLLPKHGLVPRAVLWEMKNSLCFKVTVLRRH